MKTRLLIAFILPLLFCFCSKSKDVITSDETSEEQQKDSYSLTDLNGNQLAESFRKVETPNSNPELFEKLSKYSTEFDGSEIDSNWDSPSVIFPTNSFDKSNVTISEGKLSIMMIHKDETVKYGNDFLHLYFQSGMLRTKEKITYGYFEARIKGCKIFNGTCPAFWLYNVPWEPVEGDDFENKVVYNEIDIIELQQVAKDFHIMSCNYHLMVDYNNSNGGYSKKFVRAVDMWGNNEALSKWDSRDDYHLYACENRPDSIIWYIDNQRIASVPNYYWHLPMYLTLSMGIRTPYEKYVNGERIIVPTSEEVASNAGFPADMKVDYVRVWKRKDYSKYNSLKRDYYKSVK